MSWLQERYDRLNKICQHVTIANDLPLFKEIPIRKNRYRQLVKSAHYYLYKNLCVNYVNAKFCFKNDLLTDYRIFIKNLLNRTPNGLILPKKENYLQYNDIHQLTTRILEGLDLQNYISLIHNPINIRCVSGVPDPKIDNRPRSSTKWHSDVWGGEFTNTVMIFIPVLGDMENTNIEFCEPNDEFLSLRKPLLDYDLGKHTLDTKKIYKCKLRPNYLYLTDPFLLHRTIKSGGGFRLSLDFRFIPPNETSLDTPIDTERTSNYISWDEWSKIGRTAITYTNHSIFDKITTEDGVYNKYPETYSVHKLGG